MDEDGITDFETKNHNKLKEKFKEEEHNDYWGFVIEEYNNHKADIPENKART